MRDDDMPKKMEESLKRQAAKKGLKPGTERYGAYVYGTLRAKGNWEPSLNEKRKGKKKG